MFLAAFFALNAPANVWASTQLMGVRVQGSGGGNAVVTLTFGGGIPSGWHVTGIGTRFVTIVLPLTTRGVSLGQLGYPGVNALQNVHVTAAPSEIDVQLQLSGVSAIFTATSGNTISIVVGPPARASATPAPPPPPGASATGSGGGASAYEVVPLKYADVSEIVGILVPGETLPPNDTFTPAGSIFSLPTSPGVSQPQTSYQNVGAALSQPESFGQRINDNVAVDRRLNAVILSGTPAQVATLKAEIAQIDVPLPGVMLVCEVVELTQTAAHDLGLDFTTGSNSPIASGGVDLTTGNLPAFHANFQANLFATIAHGGGRILATPRVLALNGTSAQILTGDALPIVSTTIYPGPPTITQQTVNYIAVGVNLQIQPRITSDNFVTSHVFAEVSSVTAYVPTQQGNVPQISLRQATTMATVADAEPFVIGGLLQDEEIENLSKIPGIGDLPVIGGLFRVRHDLATHTNLYIIITPHILRPGAHNTPPTLPHPSVPEPTPKPVKSKTTAQ